MNWAGLFVGLSTRSPEVAQQVMFLIFLPITFLANTFVPTAGMSPILRIIADWNPMSAFVAASRQLLGSPGVPVHGVADAAPDRRVAPLGRGDPGGLRPAGPPAVPERDPRLSFPGRRRPSGRARLPDYALGMSDAALFIRWGGAAAGRERQSVELFAESLKYLTGLVSQGKVKSVEPFFLEPHGGDLDGFFIVRGDRKS